MTGMLSRHVLPFAIALAVVGCAAGGNPAGSPSSEPVEQKRSATPPRPSGSAGASVRELSWKSTTPAAVFCEVKETKETDGAGIVHTVVSLSYKPVSSDVVVQLAAGPGTRLFRISSIEQTIAFREPLKIEDTLLGPTVVPIAPQAVPGAPATADGVPAQIVVPLGLAPLATYVGNPDPAKRPTNARVLLRFFDEAGVAVIGVGTVDPLVVPVPIVMK